MKLKFFLFLLIIAPLSYGDMVQYETRVFNLVTGEATLKPGISVVGDAAGFIVQDANDPWTGTATNGKQYKVSTLKYSYQGTVTLTVDASFYSAIGGNCSFLESGRTREAFVGWTVMQPGVSGVVYNSAGALYYDGFSGGVGVQTRWRGMSAGKPEFKATFNNSGVFAYVYVSDGPQGLYKMPGGKSVYVHTSGQVPNAVPYVDIYGLSCGAVLGVGTVIPAEPIEPPQPDIVCDFSTSGAIDLGVLDVTTANGASGTTELYSRCTGDATVTAVIRSADGKDNVAELGGLTIPVTFSNGTNTITYSANTGTNTQNIYARVSGATSLTPGEYSQSMIVYLNYE